jgi:hypothetical protein
MPGSRRIRGPWPRAATAGHAGSGQAVHSVKADVEEIKERHTDDDRQAR